MTDVLSIVVTAILAGALGYVAAVTRNGTRFAMLERDSQDFKRYIENTDHRLGMMLRLMVDVARKSGVELRTADLLEMASLYGEQHG